MADIEDIMATLASLAGGETDARAAQAAALKEPINREFLEPGQSIGQAWSNPQGGQGRAMDTAFLSMMGADPKLGGAAAFSGGIQKGMALMDTMREGADKRKQLGLAADTASAKSAYGMTKDQLDMGMKLNEHQRTMGGGNSKRDRVEPVEVVTGYDPVTGAPMTKEVMVNIDQMLREQAQNQGLQVATDVTPQNTKVRGGEDAGQTTVHASPEEQQQVRKAVSGTDIHSIGPPPARPGRTADQNRDLRESSNALLVGLDSLLDDVWNPNLSQVVGWGTGGRVKGAIARAAETPGISTLAASMEHGTLDRVIPLAKQLGVNPTDFDFKQIKASKPGMNDGVEVWRDWAENMYTPMIIGMLEAVHGKEYADMARAKVAAKIEGILQESAAPTPTVTDWSDMAE
jgi:hypothetical protein